ncbi:hypothetical protein [Haloimpatiens lingqiaonensis]|uniref:hypothetical protein n=1 Tax=Haloimpatiens lingqiaonensis TaxID=1380675 RepID=UPI0010FD06BF|nr:hypothetical protein [Haloimpatiens lingqiaonensis]
MDRDKLDVLEKLHKDKIKKMSKKGEERIEECERCIKEMQDMELQRELKYNTAITAILGVFLAIFIALAASSISYNRRVSRAEKTEKQKQEQSLAIKNDSSQVKEEAKNNSSVKKDEKPKTKEVKQEEKPYYEKIGTSLDKEEDRKKILQTALSLTGGKYEGINIKYMVSILNANGVKIPNDVSRTDTLVKELEKQGWKKSTNASDLRKGDIVFTLDTVGISGVPSHVYIFMGWEDSKKENGHVVDALSAKDNVTYHKRPITVQSETTDKMQFFMRK